MWGFFGKTHLFHVSIDCFILTFFFSLGKQFEIGRLIESYLMSYGFGLVWSLHLIFLTYLFSWNLYCSV